MIKSMTGFGRGHQVLNGRDITVEIRAVNHRYYEFSSRLPRSLGYIEEKLKSLLQGRINRGKVEISVLVNNVEAADEKITINKEIVKEYVEALRSVKEEYSLNDGLSLSDILRIPDAFTVVKTETDEEQLWADVKSAAEEALEHFIAMREAEGERMKRDVMSRCLYRRTPRSLQPGRSRTAGKRRRSPRRSSPGSAVSCAFFVLSHLVPVSLKKPGDYLRKRREHRQGDHNYRGFSG